MNVQFIEKGRIILRSLAVKELHEKHTGDNLKILILDIFRSFNIQTEQIYAATTDNGTNMIKAICLLNQIEDTDDEQQVSTDIEDSDMIQMNVDEVANELGFNKYNLIG